MFFFTWFKESQFYLSHICLLSQKSTLFKLLLNLFITSNTNPKFQNYNTIIYCLLLSKSFKQCYYLLCYFLFHAAFNTLLPEQCFQRLKFSISHCGFFLLLFSLYQALQLRTRGGAETERTEEQGEQVGLPRASTTATSCGTSEKVQSNTFCLSNR